MELFRAMLKDGLGPDKVTLICSVKMCGLLGALEWGKWVHAAIVEVNLETDVVLGTNLIEMYSKCHSIDDIRQVFNGMSNRDMASWGALIAGYASMGNFPQVNACLKDMQKQGLMPGSVMFTSILAACSQAGLVEEACVYFQMMIEEFGITPSEEHCSCMVDLFARAGRLDDASDLTTTLNLCDTLHLAFEGDASDPVFMLAHGTSHRGTLDMLPATISSFDKHPREPIFCTVACITLWSIRKGYCMHILSSAPSDTAAETLRLVWSELTHTLRSQWDNSQGPSQAAEQRRHAFLRTWGRTTLFFQHSHGSMDWHHAVPEWFLSHSYQPH